MKTLNLRRHDDTLALNIPRCEVWDYKLSPPIKVITNPKITRNSGKIAKKKAFTCSEYYSGCKILPNSFPNKGYFATRQEALRETIKYLDTHSTEEILRKIAEKTKEVQANV